MSSSEFPESANDMGRLDILPGFEPSESLPEALGDPLDTVGDGGVDRDASGRFLPGNRAAKGNPVAKQAAALRAELFACCTREAMRQGVQALLVKFARGDTQAAKLVLAYTLGDPQPLDILQTVAKLEGAIFRGAISNE